MAVQDINFKLTAMDTTIEIAGVTSNNIFENQKDIEDWFEQFENICSRFRPNSELSLLNQKPKNTVIQVHPILYEVIKKAMEYANKTDFYFNPFIGSAIKAYGYDRTFSEVKGRNGFSHQPYLFESNNYEPIVLLPIINGVIKKADEDIDLGGIAKGWSVDNVVQIVKELGLVSGIVNAGGDLFVWGDKYQTIGVSHPDKDFGERDVIQFDMRNGAVATSNTLYRSWIVDNERVHHIFDGKKGKSATTDIIQASVFSISTIEADVLAKVVCMHSFFEAIPWLTKYFPHTACILINRDGQIAMSKSIKNYVTKVVM